MSLQDVDFEMKYQAGKDEADPLDFRSRHSLPNAVEDDTEYVVKAIIKGKPAVIIDKIREETRNNATLKEKRSRDSTVLSR